MTQNNVNYSEDMSGAELLDDFITKSQENVLTSNSGLQRPSYAKEGTVWLDKTSSPWLYKFFDGTDDIIIGKFDANNNRFIPSDPMTTAGDLIVKGTDGNPTRLAPGTAGTVLTSNGEGKLPSYQIGTYANTDLSNLTEEGNKKLTDKQDVANLSQTIDSSTSKYPSNNAVNTALNEKANTDLSNVTFTSQIKNQIANWLIPDYTAGVDKGLEFTSDGYYEMRVKQTFTSSGSRLIYITINGEQQGYDTGGNWGAWNTPFYIKPGDTVLLSTTGSSISAICYPLGVN